MRWTTRLTEFLRTTANRSFSGVDRFLDNMGFPQLPQSAHATQTSRTITKRTVMNYSPPEELEPLRTRPTIPSTWMAPATGGEQPLFDRAQVERMRQAQREFPLLYGPTGPSDTGSDRSSKLQAEVQRQLEEYTNRYQEQVAKLQQEVLQLTQERDRAMQMQGVLQGDLPQLPTGNLQSQQQPRGDLHQAQRTTRSTSR